MHVTKIMIAGWNMGVFISYRREVFSQKQEEMSKYYYKLDDITSFIQCLKSYLHSNSL